MYFFKTRWHLLLISLLFAAACGDDSNSKKPLGPGCDALDCAAEDRACVDGDHGGVCGDCLGDLVDADGVCREAIRCVELDCPALNFICEEASSGRDAHCGECRPGFEFVPNEDASDGSNAGQLDGQCVPGTDASCDEENPDSIVEDCRAAHRSCEVDENGQAGCTGACEAGWRLEDASDPASACVPVKTCDDIQSTCDGVCIPHEHQDAECIENSCPAGEAFVPGAPASESCVACDFEGLEGCTEDNFPKASGADECVCVTKPGYFWNPNRFPSAGPELCDKDGDGWVDKRAADFFTDPTGDPTLKAAANCDFQIVDRFTLKNDVGGDEDREVSVRELTGGSLSTVVLQESVRNDDPEQLTAAYNAGELPELQGLRLPASALNSLTKVCADTLADFNGNGQRDLTEFQSTGLASDAAGIFNRMSYFMMLADGYFEPADTPGEPGTYVIQERTRGDDLAMRYPADAGNHWMSCPRFPDANYADNNVSKKIGTDFAAYSTPPSGHLITNRRAWQGMNHSSQFKCLNIVASQPTESADKGPHIVLIEDLRGPGSEYSVNNCRFTGDFDEAEGAAPTVADFSCQSVDPGEVTQGVSWAAVNYHVGPFSDPRNDATPSSAQYQYQRGCADSCAVIRDPACPGFADAPGEDSGKCYADGDDFGKRYCGCGMTFGGPNCDMGCPSIDMVMTSPDYNPAQRMGKYWVCAQPTASYMEAPFQEEQTPGSTAETGYRVRANMLPGGARDDSTLASPCPEGDTGCRAYQVR